MSIEFIGLPGAGKSRICQGLAEEARRRPENEAFVLFPLVDREPRAKVVISKMLYALSFAARHPGKSIRLLRLIVEGRQTNPREGLAKTLHLFSELGREKRFRRRMPVFEQGVLQAIWSIAIGAERADLAALLATVKPCLPEFVIHVEVDRAEILRRLENRRQGKSRFDRFPRDRREGMLERADELLTDLVDIWKHSVPEPRFIAIQNSEDSEIETHVEAILATLPGPSDPPSPNSLTWSTPR